MRRLSGSWHRDHSAGGPAGRTRHGHPLMTRLLDRWKPQPRPPRIRSAGLFRSQSAGVSPTASTRRRTMTDETQRTPIPRRHFLALGGGTAAFIAAGLPQATAVGSTLGEGVAGAAQGAAAAAPV